MATLVMESLEARQLLAVDTALSFLDSVDAGLYQFEHIHDPFRAGAVSVDELISRTHVQSYVPGELVVALATPTAADTASDYFGGSAWETLLDANDVEVDQTIFSYEQSPGSTVSLLRLDLGDNLDVTTAMQALDDRPDVLWSSPSFIYAGSDPRDFVPDDPQYGSQYHHPLVQNDLAWDVTLGDASVVIAITDDGVLRPHADLAANIWTNTLEIPGDGVDNDGNGYIDDVNGWDFIDRDNNPNPNGGDDHGTHVAGIAAARTDNGLGVAGTAGAATLMPLKFFDSANPGAWTSTVIAETFAYAVDNGARIVTTSYNINGFVGDPVFVSGLQYLYDQGGLHFNSGGNANDLNPARQVFEQTLLVASTTRSDIKSSFSNYGTGLDISAPGSDIFSTILNNSYGSKSGTSMASPNAAGVAALIWSAHPTWTRDQVAAQLLGTSDTIDAANPGLEGLLGAGRINSLRAVTETLAAPQIEALTGLPPNNGATDSLAIESFELAFTQVMDPASVNDPANYDLRTAGADGMFDTSDDGVLVLSLPKEYLISTNQSTVNIDDGPLGFGDYRLTLRSGGLQNPFATPLDGNGDGGGGDDLVSYFSVTPPLPNALLPSGSLIYEQTLPGAISSGAEIDVVNIDLDANQTLTVRVTPTGSTLAPRVRLIDSMGATVAEAFATAGQDALLNVETVAVGGDYSVEISSDGGTIGTYVLQNLLNAAVERELVDGTNNDSAATAEDINDSAVPLGSGATRLGVAGELPGVLGTRVDGDDFESGALGPRWTTSSSQAQGRIQVSGSQGTAAGSFAMLMDRTADGSDTLNEATWSVDLSGLANPVLSFYHAEWSDEDTALPATFTGSVNGDGVAISDDGVNWYTVLNAPDQPTGDWERYTIDLSTAASSAGMALGPNFQIKFQQFDNFPLPTDGRGYDEIEILEPTVSPDWYSFTLDDGNSATIAATASLGGNIALKLFDSDGETLIASGALAENASSVINNFVDGTSDALPARFYAQVSGNGGDYSLVVTRNADFDTEPNNAAALPQDMTPAGRALGYVSDGAPDHYGVAVTAGDSLSIAAQLPGDGPGRFDNGLDGPGGPALQLELIDPSGAVVATGTTSMSHTALDSGIYVVRASAVDAAGEYVLEVMGATGLDSGPAVVSSDPVNGALLTDFPARYRIDFSENILHATIEASDLEAGGLAATGVTIIDGDTVEFDLDPASFAGLGTYEITLPPGAVTDLQGNPGAGYSAQFSLVAAAINPFVSAGLEGSLISRSGGNQDSLTSAGDRDEFGFFAEAGELLSAVVTPQDPAVTMTVELDGLSGVMAAGPGQPVVLPVTAASFTGAVTLRISGDGSSGYDFDVYKNANLEALGESESPVSIGDSFLTFGSGRFGVVGQATGSTSQPQFMQFHDPSLFVDISGTGTPLGLLDDGESTITTTVGNSFFPAGPVTVANNGGIIAAASGDLPASNGSLPSAAFQSALFPFWDDIDADTGNVYWQERMINGIDALIVQWDNRPHFSNTGSATFQLQLFESGPLVARFVYPDVDFGNPAFDFGAAATIGYQETSTSGIEFSRNAAVLADGDVVELWAGGALTDVDEFEVDLTDQVGRSVDVVIKGTQTSLASETLELLDGEGTVLATASQSPLGVPVTNYDLGLVDFIVPAAGVYTLRLTSAVTSEYALVVTDNLVFDTEPNVSGTTLRSLASAGGALGYLEAAGLGDFTHTHDPNRFVDISDTGIPLGLTDDQEVTITTTVGNEVIPAGPVTVGNNGGIMAGSGLNLTAGNAVVPSGSFAAALLPFWDDMDADSGDVYWEERVVDGFNALIVQWDNRPHYSNVGSGTFQLQLFESGPVTARFVYPDVDFGNSDFDNGASATIGYQSGPDQGVQFSFNTAVLSNGDVLEIGGSTGGDDYELPMSSGEIVVLETNTPFNNASNQPGNNLNPRLEVLDAAGNLLDSDSDSAADGRNARLSFLAPDTGTYIVRVTADAGTGEYVLGVTRDSVIDGDFNDDGAFNCDDVDQLVSEIVTGTHNAQFDLTSDGLVDLDDLSQWLAEAATANGLGSPYLPGDANLDGKVDISDFNVWNSQKFTLAAAWCAADFNADGTVDASDFNIWNAHKFLSSDPGGAILSEVVGAPQPSTQTAVDANVVDGRSISRRGTFSPAGLTLVVESVAERVVPRHATSLDVIFARVGRQLQGKRSAAADRHMTDNVFADFDDVL